MRKFMDLVDWILRRVVVPISLVVCLVWTVAKYFHQESERLDFEIQRANMQGQLKAMCIQAHACGDDCKEI